MRQTPLLPCVIKRTDFWKSSRYEWALFFWFWSTLRDSVESAVRTSEYDCASPLACLVILKIGLASSVWNVSSGRALQSAGEMLLDHVSGVNRDR